MNPPVVEAAVAAAPDLAGLEPIEKIRKRWPIYLGAGLTLLMMVALLRELFGAGFGALWQSVPSNPLFYAAFALFYLGPPTFDWIIFRRLWNIPLSGMAALHKKRISNEVLLGYSGEAYFYAWARQHTKMVAAPFGAVKDVMILSAIAGNAVTLVMVLIALPLGIASLLGVTLPTLLVSIAAIFAMSLPFLIFSRRVFSLRRQELWWIFGIHCLRLVCGSIFVAFAWHFALPGVPLTILLFLAVGRMFVSRLPFVPNKDALFSFMIGVLLPATALSELMAFSAGLALLLHAALIGVFSVFALVRKQA